MDLKKLAEKIIAYVEKDQTPFLYYALTFLSVITLRNFLEIFSDTTMVSFKFTNTAPFSLSVDTAIAISFLHYYFFWIALWLSFALAVKSITGERIITVTKAILGFSWIIIITPIFDLLISAGKGVPIKYISPENLAGMLPFPAAVNHGEKVSILLGSILIFIYCMVKTHKIWKALLATAAVYILSLLSFIPPFLSGKFSGKWLDPGLPGG